MAKDISVGGCHFVVANDERYVSSVRAFSALQVTMLRRSIVTIVSMQLSATGSGMQFAVLKAKQEQFEEIDDEKSYLVECICTHYCTRLICTRCVEMR